MVYNSSHFNLDDYDYTRFDGPRAGEQALDFELYDVEGKALHLSDFRGKWLVLEMGSMTCPMYARNVDPIKALQQDYPDVEFVVVYVREAHPGSHIPAHNDFQKKRQSAKQLQAQCGEQRRILVDSIDGEMHNQYGAMPNSVYVINPDGKVIYRCTWTVLSKLRDVLDNRQSIHPTEHVTVSELGVPPPTTMIRTFMKAGWQAFADFFRMMPRLILWHLKADRYYGKQGEFLRQHPPGPDKANHI